MEYVAPARAADRNVTLTEVEAMLANDGFDDAAAQATELVNGLVGAKLLRWDKYGRLQYDRSNPFTRGPA